MEVSTWISKEWMRYVLRMEMRMCFVVKGVNDGLYGTSSRQVLIVIVPERV